MGNHKKHETTCRRAAGLVPRVGAGFDRVHGGHHRHRGRDRCGDGSGISENLAAYLRPTVCSITEGSCESRPVAQPGSDSSTTASDDGSRAGLQEGSAADPREPDEACVRTSEQKSEEESFNLLVVGHRDSSSTTVERLSDGSIEVTMSDGSATGLDLRAGGDVTIGGKKGKGIGVEGGLSGLEGDQEINTWHFEDEAEYAGFQEDAAEALQADLDGGDFGEFANFNRVLYEQYPPARTVGGDSFDIGGHLAASAYGAYFRGEPQNNDGTLSEVDNETGARTFTRFNQGEAPAALGWLVGGVSWNSGSVESTSLTVDANDQPVKLTTTMTFSNSLGLDGILDTGSLADLPKFIKSVSVGGSAESANLTEIQLSIDLTDDRARAAALAAYVFPSQSDEVRQVLRDLAETEGEVLVREYEGSKSTGGFSASVGLLLSLGGSDTSETTSMELQDAYYRPAGGEFERWASCTGN